MPIYEVTSPDGRKLEIEGERPPTEGELRRIFGAVGGEKPSATSRLQTMFQPEIKAAGDVADIAKGIFNTVAHPAQTTQGLADYLNASDYALRNLIGMSQPEFRTPEYKEKMERISPSTTPGKVEWGLQNPEKVPEAMLNYATEHPVISAIGVAGAVAPFVKTTAGQAADITKKIGTTVEKGITKSIRPSVTGKTTLASSQKYFSNAQDAVENIIANKSNLSLTDDVGETVTGILPQNLKQFQQAIDQTKGNIFRQYNALAQKAGGQGAKVTLDNASNEVLKVANNKVIQDFAPDVAKYAQARASSIAGKAYTAEQTQDAIKIMNQSLEAFYKNPSYDTASKAYVDAIIVNNMRNSLDDVITKAVGPGYKDLKRSYGSLKSIEKDVGHRAIIDARKNVKGLIDFTDVISGGSAVQGIVSMNPALVGQAAAMSTIKNLIKRANDPNRIVKSMFTKTEKLMEKRNLVTGGEQ